MMFLWYGQITSPAFRSGVIFFENSISSIQNFLDMESGGMSVVMGTGMGSKTIPSQLTFIFSWKHSSQSP